MKNPIVFMLQAVLDAQKKAREKRLKKLRAVHEKQRVIERQREGQQ